MKYFLVVTFVTVVQCHSEAVYNYRPQFPSLGSQQGERAVHGPNFVQPGPSFEGASATGGTGFEISGFETGSRGHLSGAGDMGHTSNLNLITGNIGGFGFNGENSINSGPELVQKHIYVHVPPLEPEEAPSFGPSLVQQQVALASQSQEKTIVYVLVKKPEDISVSAVAPTKPNKPEVYFIKYKAQKQNVIGGTDASAGSGGLSGIGATSLGIGAGISSYSQAIISGVTSTGFGGIGSGHGASGVSSRSASSSIGGISAPQYGPPGKSGPY